MGNDSVFDAESSSGTGDGDSIKVFIRVRPLVTSSTEFDLNTCVEVDKERSTVIMRSKLNPKQFTFDEVADQSVTQEGVFCSVGKKTVDGCVKGYNGTIFAYGQTGSGKTFTMLGPHEDTDNFQHELRGVIPRSFEYLFKLIKKQQEIHGDKLVFLCKCSFLEIYNEQIFDLLDTSTSSLQLRESINRGVYVEGAQEQVVTSAHEAYKVLNRGWLNRTVASTTMNHESSRSHAVFTVSVESKVNQNGVWNVKMSQLHLVDLAGSERQKDTNTSGQRLKEAGSINRSLSALGNVIMALIDVAHGKTRHIPYRDSKLSFLLRDSLGGNSKTYIVACVHPGSKCFGETLSTLEFARRAKMIKNKAVVNEDMQGSVTHLQAEIKRLKETLQQYQQNSLFRNPSAGGSETLSSESISRFKFYFFQARNFYKTLECEKQVLAENLRKQKEVCDRKDQALNQMKMVLKFREDALRKIEKAQKEKIALTPDDKADIIESQRSEIRSLQAIIDHHPEVVRYQMDNESLKAEIRALTKNDHLDEQITDELEKAFMELQAESGENFNYESFEELMRNNERNTSEIERQKAELTKLQAENEAMKRETTEELQKMQQEISAKDVELLSVQKAKEELERLFKAHQIRSQKELEMRDDLHAETIKIMTTPKKIRHSPASPCQLAASPGDRKIISCETPPEEWAEEQIDGLRQEIAKLQDEYRALKMQLEETDRNTVHLVQEKTFLEAERERMELLRLKENKTHEDKISELVAELTRLKKENSELHERDKFLASEIHDLRILNDAGDRKLMEVKNEAKEYKADKEKELSQFETQVTKLSLELSQVKESLELASEERDQLQDREETLQATLDFTAEQLKDAEESILKVKDEVKQMKVVLEDSNSKIDELEHDREKLLAQQQQASCARDIRLLECLQTIKLLRDDLQILQSDIMEAKGRNEAIVAEVQECTAKFNSELNRLSLDNERLSLDNERLQEEIICQKQIADKFEADLCVQLNENAKLSGHQNHSQKIFYVTKLKEKMIQLEKENRQLKENLDKSRQPGICNSSNSSTAE